MGTDREKVALDEAQPVARPVIGHMNLRRPDCRAQFVDRSVGLHPVGVLGDAAAAEEPRLTPSPRLV